MAIIASHPVPATTVTISISTTVRGFLVMTLGDPRMQVSRKAKTEAEARATANDLYRAARQHLRRPA